MTQPEVKLLTGGRPPIYRKTPWRWANLRGVFYKHEGGSKRERERRLRQIAAGSLRVENGLVQDV